MKYKKYPSYKDSGVEWLGEIPSEWNESRLKFIGYTYGGLSGKAGKDFGDEENLESKRFIPFTNIANNAFIKSDNLGYVIINEKEEQNKVKINDLFFLMSSENYDDLGKASLLEENLKDTYLNSFCKGFRLTDKLINPRFLNYLLSGNIYRKLLSIQGNGFTRINLRLEKLNELRLLLPSLQEQQQIANFLDKATAKIDILIEKQTKLIEILKEKRQAVISHAVTKGINPTSKMKDSGVEWLGEIPEHWEVGRLKYYTNKIGSGKTPLGGAEVYSQEGIVFIRSQNVYDIGLALDDVVYISEDIHLNMANTKIKYNDCLLNITGGSIGRSTIFKLDKEANVNQHVAIIRTNSFIIPDYLNWYLKSKTIKEIIDYHQVGGNREGLNFEQIGNFPMPRLNITEQQQIVDYIDDKTSKMDQLIEKANKSIELLKEKRTALISAAVTGKIDVREQV